MFQLRKCSTLLVFGLLFFVGCEMIVEVDLPEHEPVLVVNSFFSPENPWVIRVNHSLGILDSNQIEPVKNAKVELEVSGSQTYLLSRNSNGYYYNNAIPLPQVGKNYRVIVSAPGYEAVQGESHVPVAVQIDSVKSRRLLNTSGDIELEITINFKDPVEIENYYQIAVRRVDGPGLYSGYLEFESDDLVFNRDGGTVFTDDLFNGNSYGLKITLYSHQVHGADVRVDFMTTTEEYYKYIKSYRQYEDHDENPFAEPVFVYNNVENGLGIFAGFNRAQPKIASWQQRIYILNSQD